MLEGNIHYKSTVDPEVTLCGWQEVKVKNKWQKNLKVLEQMHRHMNIEHYHYFVIFLFPVNFCLWLCTGNWNVMETVPIVVPSFFINSFSFISQEKDETDSGYRSGTIPDEKLPKAPSQATLNRMERRRKIQTFNHFVPKASLEEVIRLHCCLILSEIWQ